MPVAQWLAASVEISVMGCAMRVSLSFAAFTVRAMPSFSALDTTVPHAWHSPQRPTHLTLCQPHSVQR
jgi:hypothetical protein